MISLGGEADGRGGEVRPEALCGAQGPCSLGAVPALALGEKEAQ